MVAVTLGAGCLTIQREETTMIANMRGVLGIVLAGGKGQRLSPLTDFRSKAAVPFGKNRLLDFAAMNMIHSDISVIKFLVQTKSQPIIEHIDKMYPSAPRYGKFVDIVPAQQKGGEEWYRGTADAVFQNRDLLGRKGSVVAAIFAADHIYAMDIRQMYADFLQKEAIFSVAVMPVPVEQAANDLGVMVVDDAYRIIAFEEKPARPSEIPGRPGWCLASMGNYLADIKTLVPLLEEDAADELSEHDFGKNVIPLMLKKNLPVFAYDFTRNVIEGQEGHYWADVGQIGSYWQANMDLCSVRPKLNLYNENWPIHTPPDNAPMAKIILGGSVSDALVSGGCIISGAQIVKSVLSPYSCVERGSVVHESVLLMGVKVGGDCGIYRTIIDKGRGEQQMIVPPGTTIGISREDDLARGFTVRDGITVVPSGYVF